MVLARGDWVHSPPSPTLARARPRAPLPLANSSSLSASARESGCAAGTTIALTMPPCCTASRSIGTPPSPPWAVTTSVRTTCSSPKRRSGLSLPYLAIDSSKGIRRKGVGMSTPRISFHSRDDEPLDDREDVVLADEAHLEVDLGELGLPVEPEVLVAEALDDLEVPVEAGDHEELLVELGALGERVELAGVEAAGDEEVPRAARGVLAHEGRLELEEALLHQRAPGDGVHPRAGDRATAGAAAGAGRGSGG